MNQQQLVASLNASRKLLGLSYQAVGDAAALDRTQVSRVMRGAESGDSGITVATLCKLAGVVGLTIASLTPEQVQWLKKMPAPRKPKRRG